MDSVPVSNEQPASRCPVTDEPTMHGRRFCQVLCGVEDIVKRLQEAIAATSDEPTLAYLVGKLDDIREDIVARFGEDAFDLISGETPGTLKALEAPPLAVEPPAAPPLAALATTPASPELSEPPLAAAEGTDTDSALTAVPEPTFPPTEDAPPKP